MTIIELNMLKSDYGRNYFLFLFEAKMNSLSFIF